MKAIYGLLLLVIAFAVTASAQTASISARDLRPIEGKQWTGTLTYLDYTSGKRTTIKSNIVVTHSGSDALSWTFEMYYPLEPAANGKDDVKLSLDGRTFNGEAVIESTRLPGGILRVVTTAPGKDDNRDATFRHTYLIGKKTFSIRKEVRFDGTDEFIERNIYSWER